MSWQQSDCIKATDKDNELISALRSARSPVVIGAIDRRYPQFTTAEFDFQKHFLTATGRTAGYNELPHEKDDVVRYTAAPADPDYPESFALLVACLPSGPTGQFELIA